MKKEYKNKAVGDGELKEKRIATKLICKNEQVMIGIGHFKEGQEIIDPGLIRAIGDNPNFEEA